MSDPAPANTDRARFRVLLTASLVSSLIMLDSNIVAVSLPAIARSLGATFADIEWVVSAYILSFAALLLAAGSFADRHGRKRITLVGLCIFGVASAACGLAGSPLVLNVARAIQGIGGSLLLTAALAVISHTFTGAQRARAYAFWGACIGIAITVGPIVGGLITNFFGWRWVFLVNLPLCAVLLFATFAVVPESRDPDTKRLDIIGIVTFSMGLFLLIWALIAANAVGWTHATILLRLAGAALLFVAFGFAEALQARPMMDFALFRQPTFLGSAFAMLGYAAGAQVMIFYLPLFLQNAFGFAPAAAGLAMIPFALPMFLTPRLGAGLAGRFSGRALLAVGLAVTVAGDLLMGGVARAGLSYAVFVVAMVVTGSGAGLLNGETAKVMQGAVPAQRAGMASGLAGTTRFVGLLLGVAGLGAMLGHVASDAFLNAEAMAGLEPAVARRVVSGDIAGAMAAVPQALQAQVHGAASAAFADGFAAASLLAAAVAGLAGILTFLLVRSADTAPARAGAETPATQVLAIE
jgi:EmrB/QacA subfamily drug resistance transporter